MFASGAEMEEFDAVAAGKELFQSVGCSECHAVEKGDLSLKSGPNLFGLFVGAPRERRVMVQGKESTVKADRGYFEKSLRHPWDALAVAEVGPLKGDAYQPLMPMYVEQLVSASALESLWHYVRTLADEGESGPPRVMMQRPKAPAPAIVWEIPGEEVVLERTRVIRAPLPGTSARALHVGQPNGMSYTFDPRTLSVRRVWVGGYLNLHEERTGRGQKPSGLGADARILVNGTPLLQPLTASGEAVDFEFKEPDMQDFAAIERHLWDDRDFADRLAALDAGFLGHELATGTGDPWFHFHVGPNRFTQEIRLADDAGIVITLRGRVVREQRFRVAVPPLSEVAVEGGSLVDGEWVLPAGNVGPFVLRGRIPGNIPPRTKLEAKENFARQQRVAGPAKPGRRPLEIPAGYSLEDWQAPTDLLGRLQVFEATGIAVAKDGTVVVATRAAGIWRVRDGGWSLFAEGTYEALGVVIEDDKGDVIVIAQKPEITRIRDADGDGRADRFETLCDDFGFHGNYHEYTHGPVKDAEGNYHFLLNLSHEDTHLRSIFKAGGRYMGSMGGYRGWACRVTPEGRFETFAMGLRSPAGIGVAPDGRIWYAENQGEYVGSSKMVPLEQGKFYGHPSGLEALPGMKPDSPELSHERWKDKLRKGAVWLPYGKLANSPGSPTWDLTEGKFGPFAGQMFVGDQTLSQVMRVQVEQVDGVDQGCAIPFAKGLSSGVMRLVFLPDGSLLLGQTGRGWSSNGGSEAALQRMLYDGRTMPAELHSIGSTSKGLVLRFTTPVAAEVTGAEFVAKLRLMSWYYTNLPEYGSPEHDKRTEAITAVRFSADRRSAEIDLAGFGGEGSWTDRIYHVQIEPTPERLAAAATAKVLEGYFTLRAIPR
jgi:hypothetical protein